MFRKKKRIVKDRLKNSHYEGCRTPAVEKKHLSSPTTEKTATFTYSASDTTENNASSLLYNRLLFKSKSKERTLYYGEKKFFVPKKNAMQNPEAFIDEITASSLK